MKAVAIILFCGGLRCADLISILCNDLKFDEITGYWIKRIVSKQATVVNNKFNVKMHYVQYITNYCNRLRDLKLLNLVCRTNIVLNEMVPLIIPLNQLMF